MPRRVRWWVATWLIVAAGTTVAMLSSGLAGVGSSSLGLALGLWVAMIVMHLVQVRVTDGRVTESNTFLEVAAVPVMLLLSPATAALVAVASGLVAESIRVQRQVEKVLLNVSWQVAGVAGGAWTYRAVAGGAAFDGSGLHLAAAAAATGVLLGSNLLALSGIVAIVTDRRWRHAALELLPSVTRDNGGAAIIGLLVTVLLRVAPLASPLLLLVALMLRQRHRSRADGYARLAAERDRFHRTVAGSSDGVVLLDVDGRIEVWNPAMVELTGIAEERALGSHLGDIGWSRLADPGPAVEEELRIRSGDRVLAVRGADVPSPVPRTTSAVITVRDVSQEAELARIRDDLVMRISHELRTPLTSLEGFLEVLTEHWDGLGDDGRRDLVAASRRGSRRLARLVENLMVWAGIESRTADAQHDAATEPASVLHDACDEVGLTDVRLETDRDVAVAASAEDVRTILVNLLSNATLYGTAPVHVAVHRRGTDVQLVVTDAGPGLPAAFRSRLFEPFSQATEGLQRTAKGLGMGLAVVRSVAETNGGHVRYDDAPRGGARFTVTLPAAAPQPVAVAAGTRTSSSSR